MEPDVLTLGWTSRLWDAFQREGAWHVGGTVRRPVVAEQVHRCIVFFKVSHKFSLDITTEYVE